ncbi:glyoxylate/hydroxypyruvate reductase A [Ancylobacter dichloromethanicus]|uniref:Glyoxylate/hydroxypyruvate reductase A n=1 Tax=Ancylobacter dichloromethanicus TaxID=518825 RepID=A0A9W6JEA6_9HYPH|nr:glyoxylate/hydroxypyruvate reductase A [Ancylobacter dichloromethanicus]MBS7552409.1 glyoxylate/hydroxypyruvate reductase A [Ancylobacter dichloromethanicus]GLK74149.1 glyoxylate/hydroxypyruvate reductase A [Ancylobacter dichloromethanicus]
MSQDALVFYSRVDNAQAWQAALAAELPDLDVRIDPAVGDPADIRYALAWAPPAGFFARFPNLELVINLGAGVDALMKRDDLVPVRFARLNDPGMEAMMASYVVFAVTRYARDIHIFERAKRRGEWEYVHPRPLFEIKVGVLGLGELGAAAAKALANMGFSVTGWSRSPKDIPGVTARTGREGLERLLGESEIVVCLVPLTPQTHHLLGERELALMPPGAKLVNVSRGALVDEAALVEALRSGQLAEATLDVFETEPLPEGHPLWALDNVLITPHVASITVPALAARDVAESIRRVRRGLAPLHEVDPRRGY